MLKVRLPWRREKKKKKKTKLMSGRTGRGLIMRVLS